MRKLLKNGVPKFFYSPPPHSPTILWKKRLISDWFQSVSCLISKTPTPILIHPSLSFGPISRCSFVVLFKTPARPCISFLYSCSQGRRKNKKVWEREGAKITNIFPDMACFFAKITKFFRTYQNAKINAIINQRLLRQTANSTTFFT